MRGCAQILNPNIYSNFTNILTIVQIYRILNFIRITSLLGKNLLGQIMA